MQQQLTDAEREQIIDTYTQLAHGSTGTLRRYWHDLMVAHVKSRSPEQVRKMEIEKGLRAA